MKLMKYNYQIFLAFLHDLFMGFASFLIAVALRYSLTDYNVIDRLPNLHIKLLIIATVQCLVFISFGLYRGMWRFSSTHDLKQIIKASFLTVSLSTFIFYTTDNMLMIPRSSLFIYFCLLILSTGGGRFIYRILKESKSYKNGKRTVILGAGEACDQLVRDIKRYYNKNINIIGILDDSFHLKGRTIHGIKVLGQISDLNKVAKEKNISQVYIAIPSATSSELRRIVTYCESIPKVDVKVLPNTKDIIDGKVNLSSLRKVKLDDLLGRDPKQLDLNSIGKMLTNKTILVTGAGGSIGSELANQICKFKPNKIILLDISEYFIYEIERKLKSKYPELEIIPIIADIRNPIRLSEVFNKHQIDNVYHAAAYKHVPLMESNAVEAILTNVNGTYTLAKAAKKAKVKRFVMVSTDKAVNPTNVMGTTKRIAEMICQELSDDKTKFTNVRFGNVLGSNGSVIPLFEEQIKNGGPVTVTHKDVIRYFMSISEAAQLILQAGSMGYGGEIFILDMGDPIRIYDLAQKMIKLSGLTPNEDIEIKVVGLRPGEKLFEELLANDENTTETPHPSVRVACAREIPEDFLSVVDNIIDKSQVLNPREIKILLQTCVEEYVPDFKEEKSLKSDISTIH